MEKLTEREAYWVAVEAVADHLDGQDPAGYGWPERAINGAAEAAEIPQLGAQWGHVTWHDDPDDDRPRWQWDMCQFFNDVASIS